MLCFTSDMQKYTILIVMKEKQQKCIGTWLYSALVQVFSLVINQLSLNTTGAWTKHPYLRDVCMYTL